MNINSTSVRAILICVWGAVFTWGAAAEARADTIGDIAAECAAGLRQNQPVVLRIGKFPCANHQRLSPFSTLLREKVQTSFAQTPPFLVVTSDRLGELVAERQFQGGTNAPPGKEEAALKLSQWDGVLQGSYELRDGRIQVEIELIWTDARAPYHTTRWFKDDEKLFSSQIAGLEAKVHEPATADRVLLHVLPNSFPADVVRFYPSTIEELKSRGYGFAIWTELERLLSDDPRFELVMDGRSLSDQNFVQELISSEQKAAVIVLTSHFIKPEKVARNELIRWAHLTREAVHYPIELRLEFYDFSKPRWPAQGLQSFAMVRGDNPVAGARAACQELVQSLRHQLTTVPAASPRLTVKLSQVSNRTGDKAFDDLSFYTHVKIASVLEKTGRFRPVTEGFLEAVSSMFPRLQKVIYDYELGVTLLEIKDKAGATIKFGPFSRASKDSIAKVELHLRDLRSGTERTTIGAGKLTKSATGILVEINGETLAKKEGIWVLDDSDLGQAISQALEEATGGIVRKL